MTGAGASSASDDGGVPDERTATRTLEMRGGGGGGDVRHLLLDVDTPNGSGGGEPAASDAGEVTDADDS